MIIDAHAHLVAPDSLYAYLSTLRASGGTYGNASPVSDEALSVSAASNLKIMDSVGTDMQLLSPRPFPIESFRQAGPRRSYVGARQQ